MTETLSMERQCGRRKKGGVYLTVPSSPNGRPIEDFLYDPPIPINDLNEYGIGPRGVYLIERDGQTHVADVIGQEYYPNVMDFVFEGAMMGISRMATRQKHTSFDYSRLTPESRLLVIHQRAYIQNYAEIVEEMGTLEQHAFCCIRRIPPQHRLHNLTQMCAGLWLHDVAEMEDLEPADVDDERRLRGKRKLACWADYTGFRSQAIEPQYQYAFFGSFPLGRIEVIEDPDDNTHDAALEAARRSSVEVALVQE